MRGAVWGQRNGPRIGTKPRNVSFLWLKVRVGVVAPPYNIARLSREPTSFAKQLAELSRRTTKERKREQPMTKALPHRSTFARSNISS